MKKIALLGIRAYQRWISPYKGFHCSFHAHTKRQTCSGYGYRVIARYGAMNGLSLLRRRMRACTAIHAEHHSQPSLRLLPGQQHRQRGDCDVLPCDIPSCNVGRACDVLDFFSGIFDLCNGDRERRQEKSTAQKIFEFLILVLIIAAITVCIVYFLL